MTISHDPTTYGWWLASRTAGIVALLAVSLTVSLGLYLAVRGIPRRPGAAGAIRAVHEHLAIVGLLAIGVHAATLLGDPWLNPGLKGILIPSQIAYRPLWVGLGIVGTLTIGISGLSVYAKRFLGPSRQRLIHRFALLGYVLAVGHSLGAGSDASTLWMRAIVALPMVPIAYFLVLRVTNPSRLAFRPSSTRARGSSSPSIT